MSPSDRSGHLPWSRPRVPARTLAAPGNAVLMRALLVGAMAAATAASMIAPRAAVRRLSEIRLCIRCWHDRNDGTIALLPFAADDVMLPGERRQLLLTTMSQIRALERSIVGRFSAVIREIHPELDRPERPLLMPVTMSLFGMMNWVYMWFRDGGKITREDYAAMATTLLLEGVKAVR